MPSKNGAASQNTPPICRSLHLAYALAAGFVDFALLWLYHCGLRRKRGITMEVRAHWMQRCCTRLARAFHLKVCTHGERPLSGLIASNHLSYLDILAYGATLPCVFVSKSEVRSWPVFGQLAQLGGTIFVERERRSGVGSIAEQMEAVLAAGLTLVLFPEGTSTDGSLVQPYYPSLLQPAINSSVAITPSAIGYTAEQAEERDLCYYGDINFAPHLMTVMRRRKIQVKIYFGSPDRSLSDRKVAARTLREQTLLLRGALQNQSASQAAPISPEAK